MLEPQARSWDRNSVCPFVCLSVTRVLYNETKEHTYFAPDGPTWWLKNAIL